MRLLLILFSLLGTISSAFASDAIANSVESSLSSTWVGILCLIVFIIGYYFIAAEDKFHLNKANTALIMGTLIFILIGVYEAMNGPSKEGLEANVNLIIIEIAQTIFFLLVSMTYIEVFVERNVFDALRYQLVSRGYTYKQLFWFTGLIAFFVSPIADNLTTALILSTVIITIEKKRLEFLVPTAINIVVAANAGGVWTPFGDITSLLVWVNGKAEFLDFFALFPASIIGWGITAWILCRYVPNDKPVFNAMTESKIEIKKGGKITMLLGITTIASAVLCHQVLGLPATWGMMFGLSLLQMYSYFHNRKNKDKISVFLAMSKIELDTLLFFFGILAAVGGLHYLGFLEYVTALYDEVGATSVNIGVGLLSAIVDNVPVVSAVLKTNPEMGIDQWLLVVLAASRGGSLISFGSAAGVGVMGKLKGIYTFGAHLKYAWIVLIGFIASILVWYVQFNVLGLY